MATEQAAQSIQVGEADDMLQCPFCGEKGPEVIGFYPNPLESQYEFQCVDSECAMTFILWWRDYMHWREQVRT